MPISTGELHDMSSDTTKSQLKNLGKQLEPVLRKHGVVRASVFGSLARGEADEASDVDVLVVFEDGRSLLDLSALRLDLVEALGREVDVVTPGGLHPKLKDRVLDEQVRIV